jgi:drug/metabolite transporter (DMT)-like permease
VRRKDLQRSAALAWGIGLVAMVFLLETAVAHRSHPSPASPWIWAMLGVTATAAFARGAWLSAKAKHTPD